MATTVVGAGAIAGGKASPIKALPRRGLGKTGEQVSILAFGGGSRFLRYEDEDVALRVLNDAIDQGISYLDTAIAYGDGKSEERYGKVLKSRRNEVFLATKIPDRKYDVAMRAIEGSLKRLQTDHVDLVHIHSLGQADDLAEIEKDDGVLKALYRIREQGMARFIGITSHTDAATLKTAIERHDLDCVQMALNAATKTGHATGFEEIALPAAIRKNLGILAMKIAGQDTLVGEGAGKAPMTDLLNYSLSLPVAACVVGMPTVEHLSKNIETARKFVALSEDEKSRIRGRVAASVAAFNDFMSRHSDVSCV